MKTEELHISASTGDGFTAWLDKPAGGKPVAYALFAYCFTARQQAAVEHISMALTQHKFAVLRLDFAGYLSKGGQGVASAGDLVDAVRFMEKEGMPVSLLVGHSIAGAAALVAADEMPLVKAIATIGAPAHEKYLQQVLDEDMHDDEYAEIVYDTYDFKIDLELLDALDEKQMQQRMKKLNKALLLMHAPQDEYISIDGAADLYITAKHPKSFVTLDGADHFLSEPRDSLYAGNIIAAWVERYLDLHEAEELRTHMEVVTRTGPASFTTEVRAGNHSLLADEPEEYGGNNLGPNPYDLLNAALGACTSMTIQMYARRKKWPLKEAIVHLKHDKVHGEDCATCAKEEGGRLDQLRREVELIGDLDEGQRSRLMEIANKCPVHKTLTSDITITTKEVAP